MQNKALQIVHKSVLPSKYADSLGTQYTITASKEHKKENGQFFTPTEISNFMGCIASKPNSKAISILDPGCGTAILSCSLIESLLKFDITSISLIAFETDIDLIPYTEESLDNLKSWLFEQGIELDYKLIQKDFITETANDSHQYYNSFDYIISNPPYFKLSKNDSRVSLMKDLVKGQPNIYSFFMANSINLLKKNGELIYIVPRSFASGLYFNSFRDYFFKNIQLSYIHLFKSRSKTFNRDKVLQETLILKAKKGYSEKVTISTSEGIDDIREPMVKWFNLNDLIDLQSEAKILFLPTTNFEERVINLFRSWAYKLLDFGIQISTGPVVSFRAKEHLVTKDNDSINDLAPLYWLNNVRKMNIQWPLLNIEKDQYIKVNEDSKKILLPNKNYIFLRRFSSKDDNSRLISSPYFSDFTTSEFIGVENKLNYIYSLNGKMLDKEIAIGLSALLNSEIFDVFFRTFNGNVNVSATEIRLMPFPDIQLIKKIGRKVNSESDKSIQNLNRIVNQYLEIEF